MMKDFLEYLFGRLKAEQPVVKEVAGQPYAVKVDGTLGEPIRELAPQWTAPTLVLGSLSGLIEAYKAKVDKLDDRVALHIASYKAVCLISLDADRFGERHLWAGAQYQKETPFVFDHFYSIEEFLIAFRASFFFNEQAEMVCRVASTVSHESSVSVADDGVSQAITVKDGAVTRTAVELPAEGIPLIPWRTFREANPVESKFLLRMRPVKDSLPQIALFEIDAKWEVETIASIAKYLREQLPDATIIA
jgi:hypothetical protein